MPLLTFWTSNPEAVAELSIEQVVSSAGNGSLKDDSPCSEEFRKYLAQISSAKIASYVNHCLTSAFNKSGMVLQDLINELGRRLDYKVTNGRYQGVQKAIGFDGIWNSPELHTIVAEVKTTDAYRISLDTIASYREKLLASNEISETSSILIVVGREDTGELEAQVRGSRHAWDIRMISVDSLIQLVQLKESGDDPDTAKKIRSLLTPIEYTRLDRVIDIVFSTAKDVESSASEVDVEGEIQDESTLPNESKGTWQFTNSAVLQAKREAIVAEFGREKGTVFVKNTRALYWDSLHVRRLTCTMSKRYPKGSYPYWYAYHPQWDTFLSQGDESFMVLGCMDLPFAFAIPWKILRDRLETLNTTTKDGHKYWHINLIRVDGGYSLLLPKSSTSLPLEAYKVLIEKSASAADVHLTS